MCIRDSYYCYDYYDDYYYYYYYYYYCFYYYYYWYYYSKFVVLMQCVLATSKPLYLVLTYYTCLLYTSPSPRDKRQSRMPSSA